MFVFCAKHRTQIFFDFFCSLFITSRVIYIGVFENLTKKFPKTIDLVIIICYSNIIIQHMDIFF